MSWIEHPPHSSLEGRFNLNNLQVDEAYINITSDAPFQLYTLLDECYQCPFSFLKIINSSEVLKVSTKYSPTWRLYNIDRPLSDLQIIPVDDRDSLLCEVRLKNFGEFGVYDLLQENGTCTFDTIQNPVNITIPGILICAGILLVALIYILLSFCIQKKKKKDEENPTRVKKKRVVAIDTFRGLALFVMIFINFGGGGYVSMDHEIWNGIQFADFFFPWFAWIMGVCIPIVVKGNIKKNISKLSMLNHIIQRTIKLFILGLIYNTIIHDSSLDKIRIPGVLQRLSLSYFIVAFVLVILPYNNENTQGKDTFSMKSLLYLLLQWLIMLCVLGGHIFLTFFLPIPGCPTGYIGPGGIQKDGAFFNCTGGAAGYIDNLILGANHMLKGADVNHMYKGSSFDPEGILGTLSTAFQVFLGAQAGFVLLQYTNWRGRIKRWAAWGVGLIIVSIILSHGRSEGGWIPMNKNLWSLSFVFVTSGAAFLILCLLYYLIDVAKVWTGGPFVYTGMNSTVVYMGSGFTGRLFPWYLSYGPLNTHFTLTLEALWGSLLWTIVAFWLYTKKFFVTV